MALMLERSITSSIFRYIRNNIEWLRIVTGIPDAEPISRAHPPRLLEKLDWDELNELIDAHFGIQLERTENQEWVAIDGKVMKGTLKSGNKQAVVLGVTHALPMTLKRMTTIQKFSPNWCQSRYLSRCLAHPAYSLAHH